MSSTDIHSGMDARKVLRVVCKLGARAENKPGTGEIEVWHPDAPELGRVLIQHVTRRKDASRSLTSFARRLAAIRRTELEAVDTTDVSDADAIPPAPPSPLSGVTPQVVKRVIVEEIVRRAELSYKEVQSALVAYAADIVVESVLGMVHTDDHPGSECLQLLLSPSQIQRLLERAGLDLGGAQNDTVKIESSGNGFLRVRWTETVERTEEE